MKKTTTCLRKLQTSGLIMLLLCCGALGARGQADAPVEKLWDRTYGGEGFELFNTVAPAWDGGFFLGGASNSDAGFDKSEDARGGGEDFEKLDCWLVRVDALGSKVWDKTYGGNKADGITAIVPTPDGGVLLGCSSDSDASFDKSEDARGGADYWLLRLDANGNKLWDKIYGGENGDELTSIVATPDGGFLLGGYSNSEAGFEKSQDARGERDYWIVRIDAQGNQLWDKTYGGADQDKLYAMLALTDGGFLLGGNSSSDAGFDKSEDVRGDAGWQGDYWLVRIDAEGNKLWDKTYGGNDDDELNALVATEDGGFLLGGNSSSDAGFEKSEDGHMSEDYWVVRVDADGNKLWDKIYGGDGQDWFFDMVATEDGGFLLGGGSDSGKSFERSELSRGAYDYWLVRIDAQGRQLWDKAYGSWRDEELASIAAAADGDFVLGGYSYSNSGPEKSEDSKGENDYWLVKIADSTTITSRPAAFHAEALTASARPNPVSGKTTFVLNLDKPASLTLELRDVAGRIVAKEAFPAPAGQSERGFDASELSAGVYFYAIRAADGRKAEGKLIVK